MKLAPHWQARAVAGPGASESPRVSGFQCRARNLVRRLARANGSRVVASALALLLAFAALNAAAASRSLFFPHLISGLGFDTRVVLTNPSGSPAQIILTARSDDGGLQPGPGIHNPA